MGRRGPAAKPTQLRILHGDRKDRINDGEPVPPEAEVACPDWASDPARAIWERLLGGAGPSRSLPVTGNGRRRPPAGAKKHWNLETSVDRLIAALKR